MENRFITVVTIILGIIFFVISFRILNSRLKNIDYNESSSKIKIEKLKKELINKPLYL